MPFNKRVRPFRWAIFFPLVIAVITLVLGAAVKFLWNAILPGLINVKTISFWQAVGLLVLCRILFGNFGRGRRGGGGPPMHRGGGALRDKLMNMTQEERERFREEWRNRCRPKRDR